MNGNYSPALNLDGFLGIEALRNAPPGPDPDPGPGPVAPMQSLEDADPMPLERTHEVLPYPHGDDIYHDIYHDVQLHDSSPQSESDDQYPPMIDHLQRQEIAHTQHLDNIARVLNDAARATARANISASNERSAARYSARSSARSRSANFKGHGQPGGSKSKRKKRRTTRRKKTRKHTRK